MSEPLDHRAELKRVCKELGLPLPEAGALDAIIMHLQELYRWNERFNLTGIRSPAEGVRRHAAESLAALPFLHRATAASSRPLLADLGSGNGYPGLPLLHSLGAARGLLVEKSARKADYLRSVVRRTDCQDRVSVFEGRLESESQLPERPQIVTLRAFPEPDRWVSTLAVEGRWVLAWLARRDAERIAHSPRISARAVLEPLPTHPDSTLLVIPP
jgi:16S rRNA G527 N7-methylase RsmG